MGGVKAALPMYSEEIEEVHVDERVVARLGCDVQHIRADIARIEGDVREIRGDIKGMKGEIAEMRTQFANFEASLRIGFIVLAVIQLVIAGGAPIVAANALKWITP
jgi:outer membrane murein-binding lipoprotein Lpp